MNLYDRQKTRALTDTWQIKKSVIGLVILVQSALPFFSAFALPVASASNEEAFVHWPEQDYWNEHYAEVMRTKTASAMSQPVDSPATSAIPTGLNTFAGYERSPDHAGFGLELKSASDYLNNSTNNSLDLSNGFTLPDTYLKQPAETGASQTDDLFPAPPDK